MAQDTVKHWSLDEAPARVALFGDKTVQIESVEHIISFPGGAIEVARTEDGLYWAHIIVNRDYAAPGFGRLRSVIGEVKASRLQIGHDLTDIPGAEDIAQIAVLIGRQGDGEVGGMKSDLTRRSSSSAAAPHIADITLSEQLAVDKGLV